jgi:hypothetical protein
MPLSDVIRYELFFCSVGLYIASTSTFCILSGVWWSWMFSCFRFSFLDFSLGFLAAMPVQVISSPNDLVYTSAAPVGCKFLTHIGFSCSLAYPCLVSCFFLDTICFASLGFASLAIYSIFILF